MTNEEMRKRLEEAAKEYALRNYGNGEIMPISDFAYVAQYASLDKNLINGFFAGAELGYKEAIKQARIMLMIMKVHLRVQSFISN